MRAEGARRKDSRLTPAHHELICLLAQAAVDELWEELEGAASATNATEEAGEESRDV